MNVSVHPWTRKTSTIINRDKVYLKEEHLYETGEGSMAHTKLNLAIAIIQDKSLLKFECFVLYGCRLGFVRVCQRERGRPVFLLRKGDEGFKVLKEGVWSVHRDPERRRVTGLRGKGECNREWRFQKRSLRVFDRGRKMGMSRVFDPVERG